MSEQFAVSLASRSARENIVKVSEDIRRVDQVNREISGKMAAAPSLDPFQL
jgi:hypothetical protein